MLVRLALLAALTMTAFTWASDGEDPIVADRPGFGDSVGTLLSGVLQFELGYAFSKFDNGLLVTDYDEETGTFTPIVDNQTQKQDVGEIRIRYGLSDKWELRIDLGSFTTESKPDDSGFTSAGLSLKNQFYEKENTRMATAFGVITTTGVGFSESDANFYVAYIAETEAMGLPWSVYGEYSEGDDALLASLYTGGGLTGNWTWSAGVAGTYAHGESNLINIQDVQGFTRVDEIPVIVDDENQYYLDLNFVYLLDHNSAIDLYVGTGLDDNSPDYFFGFGYAHRF